MAVSIKCNTFNFVFFSLQPNNVLQVPWTMLWLTFRRVKSWPSYSFTDFSSEDIGWNVRLCLNFDRRLPITETFSSTGTIQYSLLLKLIYSLSWNPGNRGQKEHISSVWSGRSSSFLDRWTLHWLTFFSQTEHYNWPWNWCGNMSSTNSIVMHSRDYI